MLYEAVTCPLKAPLLKQAAFQMTWISDTITYIESF